MRLKFHPIMMERRNTALLCLVWMELNYIRCPSSFLLYHPFLSLMRSSSPLLRQHHKWLTTTRGRKSLTLSRIRALTFPTCSEGGCFFWQCSELVEGEVCVETLTRSTWSCRPSVCWPSRLRFPPQCSLETCCLAATHKKTLAHAWFPRVPLTERPAGLVHSTRCATSTFAASLLSPKQQIGLLFVFPLRLFRFLWLPPSEHGGLRLKCRGLGISRRKMKDAAFYIWGSRDANSEGHFEQSVENLRVEILSLTTGMSCCRGVTVIFTKGHVSIVRCFNWSALCVRDSCKHHVCYRKCQERDLRGGVGLANANVCGLLVYRCVWNEWVHCAVFSGLEYKE